MSRRLMLAMLVPALVAGTACQTRTSDFVAVRIKRFVLAHVDLIDGTGTPVKTDQAIVVDDGRIAAVGPAGQVAIRTGAQVLDLFGARGAFVDERTRPLLAGSIGEAYDRRLRWIGANAVGLVGWDRLLKLEMTFERRFVQAGGRLMAGADPTGWGGVVAGLADQRNLELLVESGFTIEEAVQIATANGAAFLGESATRGTVSRGQQADLVVIGGSLVSDVRHIRQVEIVFKDGVGFDAPGLLESERGRLTDPAWPWWIGGAIGVGAVLLLMIAKRVEVETAKVRGRLARRLSGQTFSQGRIARGGRGSFWRSRWP